MAGHHHHGHGHAATARALLVTLATNAFLTLLKWTAFAVTGSASLFAEAMHSTADLVNPVILQVGARLASRDADPRHPRGYGRERLFWSLIAAIVMLLVGGVANGWHGIQALRSGEAPHPSPIALGIMGVALALESWSLIVSLRAIGAKGIGDAWRAVRGSRDTAALAIAFENAADILGVLLAFTGFALYVATGNAAWDAIFSILIALLLTASSVFLILRNRSLITGEAPDAETAQRIRDVIAHRGSAEVLEVTVVMADEHRFDVLIRLRWHERWFAIRYDMGMSRFRASAPVDWAIRRIAHERTWLEHAVRGHFPDARDVHIVAE
jgi:cation diffusion facilitator family transporter